MVELMGILSTFQVAMENGYRQVCLESDSTVAIYRIEKSCPQNHPFASIVSRINRLKMQEWMVSFQHIYMQANHVVDLLANHTLSCI
jgi:ribonuclease HI